MDSNVKYSDLKIRTDTRNRSDLFGIVSMIIIMHMTNWNNLSLMNQSLSRYAHE